MKCPFCKKNGTDVLDSRQLNDGELVKRRRKCNSCKKKFTTHEFYHLNDQNNDIEESNSNAQNKRDIYDELRRIHGESYLSNIGE